MKLIVDGGKSSTAVAALLREGGADHVDIMDSIKFSYVVDCIENFPGCPCLVDSHGKTYTNVSDILRIAIDA